MRSPRQLGIVAALLLQSLTVLADDVITNVMSSIASYQYAEDYDSAALSSGGILSPLASIQYPEIFDDTALSNGGISSLFLSYHYAQEFSGEVFASGGVISPFLSFHYLEDFRTAALVNGGILSPFVSYQYFEWPGDDVLRLQSSPWVSYYYQFLDAPPLIVLPTTRLATVAETTPAWLPSSSQLESFEGGAFTVSPAFPPNPDRMTVVLTHGWISQPNWNSQSGDWRTNIAAMILSKVTPPPNILAWDWSKSASSWLCDPGKPEARTPDEGRKLGQALLGKLGPGYSQPIHFIGHSLGTLVNAFAADYVHETSAKTANAYLPANTHLTLFDEAEIAQDLRCPQFGAKVLEFLTRGNPLAPKANYDHPLPKQFAWADNYVSAFGFLHPESANVILARDFPASASDPFTWIGELVAFHGYPMEWYGNSITNPASDSALMGFRWSFEKNSLVPPPAVNTAFLQASSGSELDLTQIMAFQDATDILSQRVEKLRGTAYASIGQFVGDTITAHGQVTGEMLTAGPPTSAGNTIINWFIHLFTTISGGGSGPMRGPHPLDGGGDTNLPAYAWIPLSIPSDAVSMSFDFKIQGDWGNDSLAAALNRTNVLSLAASQIETNVLWSSGLIDVSAFAGQTNEFFVGIVGGTSTNAQLTVQDVQFYNLRLPSLQVKASGGNLLLSWPLSAQNFSLQSTTDLTDTNSWTTLTNTPAVVDLQNTVTNPISGGGKFYRLKK
jgi:hypothetical protein